jgi:hypothetical protein
MIIDLLNLHNQPGWKIQIMVEEIFHGALEHTKESAGQ